MSFCVGIIIVIAAIVAPGAYYSNIFYLYCYVLKLWFCFSFQITSFFRNSDHFSDQFTSKWIIFSSVSVFLLSSCVCPTSLSICVCRSVSPIFKLNTSVFLWVCRSFSLALSASPSVNLCLAFYLAVSVSLCVSVSVSVCLSRSVCLSWSLRLSRSVCLSRSIGLFCCQGSWLHNLQVVVCFRDMADSAFSCSSLCFRCGYGRGDCLSVTLCRARSADIDLAPFTAHLNAAIARVVAVASRHKNPKHMLTPYF